ncbi:hypothetical protein [Arthrobacter bambusae]|uniref:hypothetical protein n=1 Tax=Arthrobacter bambusae TaxID=1338426 RepID=UPI00278B61F3|nr:hypothetical protein [Arthrobacter bambusae]MDQ0241503.1 hypothetical protein [Arthrobacter bambusae]
MSDSTAILVGVGAAVFGMLMILARNLYASFMLMLLRGFGDGTRATKGMGRLFRVGMAVFGGVVVVIGVAVAAGGL